MYAILAEFFQIKKHVFQFLDKYKIAEDRKHYTKAVCLFENVLRDTSTKLENIYYDHILRPQINVVHTKMRDETVNVASLIVVLFITKTHPTKLTVASQDLYDLVQDTLEY